VPGSTCAIWDLVNPYASEMETTGSFLIHTTDQTGFFWLGKKSFLLESIFSAPAAKESSELYAQLQFSGIVWEISFTLVLL